MADSYEELFDVLKKEESFFIVSHYLPDGDSLGSSLAFASFLLQENKKVFLYCRDAVPLKYRFLDNANMISDSIDSIDADTVLLILDCSDLSRTGLSADQVKQFKLVVNIDHHITNEYYGGINLVIPDAAATGEIVYEIISQWGGSVDYSIARALYVAILTDTGSFKYENTTSRTHRIVADLMEYDLNPSFISLRVFDEKPLPYFLLLKKALSTLELWQSGKIAFLTLNNEMLLQEGATMEMLDGMVNYAKNIDTVEIGIIFYIDCDSEVKVGLRSKTVDVSSIAEKFNGGGHVRAAGFRIGEPYEVIKKKTLDEAVKLIENTNS